MFKPKIKKEYREILIELLVGTANSDGNLSYEKLNEIKRIEKLYKIKNYQPKNLSPSELRSFMMDISKEDVSMLLTHCILFATHSGEITKEEMKYVNNFYDLLALEDVARIQKLLDEHCEYEIDVKVFLFGEMKSDSFFDEAIKVFNNIKKSVDQIDDSLLTKDTIQKAWKSIKKSVRKK